MAEGCYEYPISVSGKAQSLFQFSLDLSKEPSKRFHYLVRAVLQGCWMN